MCLPSPLVPENRCPGDRQVNLPGPAEKPYCFLICCPDALNLQSLVKHGCGSVQTKGEWSSRHWGNEDAQAPGSLSVCCAVPGFALTFPGSDNPAIPQGPLPSAGGMDRLCHLRKTREFHGQMSSMCCIWEPSVVAGVWAAPKPSNQKGCMSAALAHHQCRKRDQQGRT